MQFAEPRTFDLLALAILAATLVLSRLIETSRLGYSLRAIKENEQAAEAMGVDSFRCKMVAYMLSAAPAAIVGRRLRPRHPLRRDPGRASSACS